MGTKIIDKAICCMLTLLLFCVCRVNSSCDPTDSNNPSCKCKTEKGFTVDLEKIFEDMKGAKQPLFSVNTHNYEYSFQPCKAFDCGAKKDASVCQNPKQGTMGQSYVTGIQSKATFTGSIYHDDLQLVYQGDPDETTQKPRLTNITLKCNKEQTLFSGKGETTTLHYEFVLETPRVCPPKGLSTGSILLIVFFVLIIVYLVGGILFLKFVRGATGMEMIPNLEFWKDLPSLVKDGFLFVSRGCKTDPTYNEI